MEPNESQDTMYIMDDDGAVEWWPSGLDNGGLLVSGEVGGHIRAQCAVSNPFK